MNSCDRFRDRCIEIMLRGTGSSDAHELPDDLLQHTGHCDSCRKLYDQATKSTGWQYDGRLDWTTRLRRREARPAERKRSARGFAEPEFAVLSHGFIVSVAIVMVSVLILTAGAALLFAAESVLSDSMVSVAAFNGAADIELGNATGLDMNAAWRSMIAFLFLMTFTLAASYGLITQGVKGGITC